MKIEQRPTVAAEIMIRLTEEEARALAALVSYGDDAFLRVFYERLGRSYLEPHEAGLRSLFRDLRQTLPGLLRRADAARAVFQGAKLAQEPARAGWRWGLVQIEPPP